MSEARFPTAPDGFHEKHDEIAARITAEDARWDGGAYVPPGAQEKTLEQQRVEAALAAQREAVQKAQRSKQELLYSSQGLRGLFPTNIIRAKIVKKPSKR